MIDSRVALTIIHISHESLFLVADQWKGECVDSNDGFIEYTSLGTFDSVEECLQKCRQSENVSGCLYDKIYKKCYFYTSPAIAKGSGDVKKGTCYKLKASIKTSIEK